jgi:two-component system, cell cycle sensor histidine kinase and response regulator CckA
MALKTVTVPDEFVPLFEEAESFAREFFGSMEMDPSQGTIRIGGRRYILVAADSLSVGFHERFAAMFPGLSAGLAQRAAASALYDIAFNAGRNDASSFHETMGVTDPLARLSSGPVQFGYSGWARVHIWPPSRAVSDETYQLIYDHPNSFEADAWLARQSGDVPAQPVCHMSAGYSSGWCTESFGIPLTAREVFCRANGDACCRFVMAHESCIDETVERFLAAWPDSSDRPEDRGA